MVPTLKEISIGSVVADLKGEDSLTVCFKKDDSGDGAGESNFAYAKLSVRSGVLFAQLNIYFYGPILNMNTKISGDEREWLEHWVLKRAVLGGGEVPREIADIIEKHGAVAAPAGCAP